MQLPLEVRLKLLRQRVLAALGVGGHRPVRLLKTPGGLAVEVDGRQIHVPSPLRWKLYRQGWAARLDRLELEYGVGRHFRLHPGDVVLDVGANVGEFAFVADRHRARIFCVEPDPTVFSCLAANIAGLAGASAHELVVWKESGEIDFGLAPDRADSSVFTDGAARIKRQAQTLADFAREHALARADLLKCDAEGAEPEVLEGAGQFLAKIRAVALDTGPERNGQPTALPCAEILAKAGFRVLHETIGTRKMTYGINLRNTPT
ncbi:MAG: FkbM family methyltransferase [Parvularculaceae bacterium]|nr:FkbM family methyltransferase [Parvularculaceae bacterium]